AADVAAHDDRRHDRDDERDADRDADLDPPVGRVARSLLREQGYAIASSSARRTRTFASSRRYSADPNASSGGAVPSSARAAATAGAAPEPNAASAPV